MQSFGVARIGLALALVSGASLQAQSITGIWQSETRSGNGLVHLVLNVSKTEKSSWSVKFYILEQGPEPIDVTSVSVRGPRFQFKLEDGPARYAAKVSADGNSFTGTWTAKKVKAALNFRRATKENAWKIDSTSHTVQFITVDKNVQLEVVDWGGTGRPLVFLAGLGNTAHVFDKFAPKFTANYHVYGITRRGWGVSSVPAVGNGNYSADRLGNDVLTVMDALKLDHPILAGHSIAGEELSSIGSRYPEKVAGLVYLDAGWPYAYVSKYAKHPSFEEYWLARFMAPFYPNDKVEIAIDEGEQSYTHIGCPVLAIFAFPHRGDKHMNHRELRQINAFEAGVSTAHVVRLPNAGHYVFLTNEADVIREMHSFMDNLPS